MKNYLVEFIGSYFLILVVGLTVIAPGAGALAPVAIGLTLMVMVYAGGPISGGHYNPAVTLAVFLRGKCRAADVLPYMLAQFVAAAAAAQTALYLKAGSTISAATPHVPAALLVEFLFTFALAFTVLTTATSAKSAGNSYFGFAIGSAVLVGAFAAGAISGAAFNPAVALGVTLMGLSAAANIWIFFLANFAGGAVAAVVYRLVNPDECTV
jgi:aquaporin Z